MNPRQRRLAADWEALRAEYSGHSTVGIEPIGPHPPDEYHVLFMLPGMCLEDGHPTFSDRHEVRIQLPLGYPREPPYCTSLTPIFHPNVSEHYCIGDYWAAGETLVDIVAKIGDMIQFRIFNPKSPLDPVAARYAEEHPDLFPLGNVDLWAPEVEVVQLRSELQSLAEPSD